MPSRLSGVLPFLFPKNTDVNRIAKATKSILRPEIRQNILSQESGRTVKNK
jgi:hypothetical protein